MGLRETLKESLLGKEVSLSVCSLPRKAPLDVLYTYVEGKPRSHRLEFRRTKRTLFEMFLPRFGEDISRLCTVLEGQGYRQTNDEVEVGFWLGSALRLIAGKPMSCHDLFTGPDSTIRAQFGNARATHRYRLARCQSGSQRWIVLISSRHSSQSSALRKSQSTECNWIKLGPGESSQLVTSLRSLVASNAYANVIRKEGVG